MELTGRPTKYTRDCNRIARNICALGGIDEDLARTFDVDVSTISNWKNNHPSFLDAVTKAKLDYDTRVERALFERATGYSHQDVDIRTVSLGNNKGSEIVQTPITKHYPPDATSMIFWLKNRQPDKWRDVQRSEIAMIAKVEVQVADQTQLLAQLAERGVVLPGME